MERILKERILFLELANTRHIARLEAHQLILDKSVPSADFEILNRKHALLMKHHQEALEREKEATDYRIATEPRENELRKLTTRVLELEASLSAANQKVAGLETLLNSDARFTVSTAGASIRIAALEAELANAEKQTQLARSRERATNETHTELEDRIKKLEVQVVAQATGVQELSVSEVNLRNQLEGTIPRDQATQLEGQLATLKEEVSRVGVELIKQKEIASIAAAQSVTITTNMESSTAELALLRYAVRDLQAKGDQAHLMGELYQRLSVLQLSEASSQHKADHYRSEYQRLSLTHHKLVQKVDEFLSKYFTKKEQYRTIIHGYHQRVDDAGMQAQKWFDKLKQIMDSYRSAETRITELTKNNRTLRDRRAEVEGRVPALESQVHELEVLVDTLRKGSPEAERVAEWGAQAVTGKLELLAMQRRIMGLQEHESYLTRVQTALEATIRRMEEQSLKEELAWERKSRAIQIQSREIERRLLEKDVADDTVTISHFEQTKATEPPPTSLPLNERLESALRQLEEAQKIISTQNATILNLNTSTLTLNAKIRAQEDLVLEKESQIHELNVRMARAAVAEASSIVSSATDGLPTIATPPVSTTEVRTLQTMYQFACNTIEGLRDMIASKEDAVLRYQQMMVQARESHRGERRVLEDEIQMLKDRIAAHEGDKALKEITDDLKRVEQTPKAPMAHDGSIPPHEVDAMLHSKQHEIRDMASQLDVARVDAATATLQLESAIKQRDNWRSKYDADIEGLRTRYTKEREMDASIMLSEKESLRQENVRLQKELSIQQHEVVKLRNDLAAEIARAQMLDQQIQRAPSESLRDQLNIKEKKLQTLQTAIAMLKQELVAASQAIAEKSIRENREEIDKDSRNNNKNKGDTSFISDEQVEPLVRRIEALQVVINRMKADHTTLAQAEGQLRTQLGSLQRERTALAGEVARHESDTLDAKDELRRCQRQLQDARDTIANLEKRLASAHVRPPVSILKPSAAAEKAPSESAGSTSGEKPKKSQTQLLRARSKNNNPPTKPNRQPPATKPVSKPAAQLPRVPSTKSESSDDSDYSLDFDDDDDNDVKPPIANPNPNTATNTNITPKGTEIDGPKQDTHESHAENGKDDGADADRVDHTQHADGPKGKNKDNKTAQPKPKPKPSTARSTPPEVPLPKSKIPRLKPSAEQPAEKTDTATPAVSKDNKHPQSMAPKDEAGDDAKNQRKLQVMAKWEEDKKAQKQIETLKTRLTALSAEHTATTQQVVSLREMLTRTQTEKASIENSYNALKLKQEKETQQYSSLSPSVEHVLQLKTQISQLEDEVSRLDRVANMEQEQQIATLKHKSETAEERVRVLELLLTACRDDLGAKIPQQTKELTFLVSKLQTDAKTHADVILEKDNQIMELRFDKEELRRSVSRLEARIADLELLSKFTTSSTSAAGGAKGREAELQSVVTALQSVSERLKSENDNLKKTVVSNTKYMEVVKENKTLKQKLADIESRPRKEEPPSTVPSTAEIDQLKKRLAREAETNKKLHKIIEEHENANKQHTDVTKKLTQVQRNLEATLAAAHETIRKKEADNKRLLVALESSSAKPGEQAEDTELLEAQLTQKENDYVLLLGKFEDLEDENKDLRAELSAFDDAFFMEIEDLKNNYQSALVLISEHETKLASLGALS